MHQIEMPLEKPLKESYGDALLKEGLDALYFAAEQRYKDADLQRAKDIISKKLPPLLNTFNELQAAPAENNQIERGTFQRAWNDMRDGLYSHENDLGLDGDTTEALQIGLNAIRDRIRQDHSTLLSSMDLD